MNGPAIIRTGRLEEPTLHFGERTQARASAYAGIAIDAAVNLTEDPHFREIPLGARLAQAVSDQRTFLNSLFDPGHGAVFDLRIIRRPGDRFLRSALVIRAVADEEESAARSAQELAQTVAASVPGHVLVSFIEDRDELLTVLNPLGGEVADAAFVVREEMAATPTRPDLRQRFGYLYSVVPFGRGTVDWSPLYRRLLSADEPVVLSIALQPRLTAPDTAHMLNEYATVYGQLAQSDRKQAGLYSGEQTLAAESMAVDASAAFANYAQTLGQRHFAMRAMLASTRALPAGMAQVLGGIASPAEGADSDPFAKSHAASVYRLRGGVETAAIAEWDLRRVDVMIPPGSSEIWGRPNPPPPSLAELVAIGDVRDASAVFRLPIAASGDLAGIEIRRGRGAWSWTRRLGSDQIVLGTAVDGGAEISVAADSLAKHTLIAGSTGSGKTTLVLEILRQLWPAKERGGRRIPFLVIEPVNDIADDYRKLLGLPELADDLVVFTCGDERHRPLRFNPFAVPEGVVVGEHMSALLSAFKAAFGLFDPLPAIYEEAIAETYATAGILPSETSQGAAITWPTVIGFSLAMDRATQGLGYAGEVKANLEAASTIRAKQLASGPCASAFRTDLPLDVNSLLARPTIVELKALGSTDEQALLIALLLNAITEHYKANRGAQSHLRHVTVIEEAHRLLARAKGSNGSLQGQAKEQAAEAFANVLAENRKYGEGIIIAEQIPSKLVEDAVKNTNLKVMCRLTAEEEREYLGQSMAMSPEQRLAAARLQQGEAMAYSDELPYTVEVRGRFTLDGAEIPDFIPAQRTVPFRACELCPSQCDWRPVGLALSRRPNLAATRDAFIEALYVSSNAASATDSGTRASTELAARVVAEAWRYPAVAGEDLVGAAALCTVVHLLESRVRNMGWIRDCVQRTKTAATMPTIRN